MYNIPHNPSNRTISDRANKQKTAILALLTITTMNTLSPNASEISVLSPFACVQAAQAKKFSMKMPVMKGHTIIALSGKRFCRSYFRGQVTHVPTNSASSARHSPLDLLESSSVPRLYPIVSNCVDSDRKIKQNKATQRFKTQVHRSVVRVRNALIG